MATTRATLEPIRAYFVKWRIFGGVSRADSTSGSARSIATADRGASSNEPVRRAAEDAASADVIWLQRKLTQAPRRGGGAPFYTGNVHGQLDRSTVEALKAFQLNRNLAPTGDIDDATRRVLAKTPPFTFEEQLAEELSVIAPMRASAEISNQDPVEDASRLGLLGLAFSGGGIRSATFNLGILQALARLQLLRRIDYLSTVSGGGYIGSWLSAWVHRHPHGLAGVEHDLSAATADGHAPEPIQWLRRFSNYLTPKLGLLSTDTLAAIVTYGRNFLLTLLSIALLASALLLLPWVAVAGMLKVTLPGLATQCLLAGAGVFALGAALAGIELRRAESETSSPDRRKSLAAVTLVVIGALLISGALPVTSFGRNAGETVLAGIVAYSLPWMLGRWWARRQEVGAKAKWTGLAALTGGAVLGLVLWLFVDLVVGPGTIPPGRSLAIVTFGFPAALLAVLLALTAHVGIAGRQFREPAREWCSRFGALLVKWGVLWTVVAGISLYGPFGVALAGATVTALGGVGWILTTVAGLLSGFSRKTTGSSSRGNSRSTETLAAIGPPIFVTGMLIALSVLLYHGFEWATTTTGGKLDPVVCVAQTNQGETWQVSVTGPAPSGATQKVSVTPPARKQPCRLDDYVQHLAGAFPGNNTPILPIALFAAALFAVAIARVLSWRVDVNVFALHMFYRNRLERCYLGASNPTRRADRFTGLDPRDSPRLEDIRFDGDDHRQRPIHIINTALNVTNSDNLAWQERKAASFTFTPYFCGYELTSEAGTPAYQRTEEYLLQADGTRRGWLDLGVPLTISGAAASPNAGYHTSPAVAFLMTVFNLRLGWWMQNPRYNGKWSEAGPSFGLTWLLQELLARTTETSDYVYLSDGGHFENLGIYELVRRRVRYIIACDAGCDPHYHFEDLGNAVRKCKIDLGIDIDIKPRPIAPDMKSGYSQHHCAVGIIHYEQADPGAAPGYLLYIKASLTGDEAADVRQYKKNHPDFPHETTANQWFAESQFESYRCLGEHCGTSILADVVNRERSKAGDAKAVQDLHLAEVFNGLHEKWYPPSAATEKNFSHHAQELERIFERIRADAKISFLEPQVYPEWNRLTERYASRPPLHMMLPKDFEAFRAAFYLCNSLIQLMENVYLDLNLEVEYDHPDNRGWMNYFRHWSWSGMLRITWSVCASTYGARFQQFCRYRLNLDIGTAVVAPPIPALGLPTAISGQVELPGVALNFLERQYIDNIVQHWSGGPREQLFVHPLVLQVCDPLATPNAPPYLELPFGCALIQDTGTESRLLYVRVQDHLRRMGLGRRGVDALRRKYRDAGRTLSAGTSIGDMTRYIGNGDPGWLDRVWADRTEAEDSAEWVHARSR